MSSSSSQSQLPHPVTSHDYMQTDIAPGIIRIPTPPTHDISNISHHAPSFRSVAACLRESVDALRTGVAEIMATRGKSRYLNVHVLLLSWKEDDLVPRVSTELKELGDMFDRTYHYHVEYYQIPEKTPGIELQARLLHFVGQYAKQETLLIVCYGGHAIQDPLRSEPPIWASKRTMSARLPSSIVQAICAECASDVLLLYDCCHAAPTDPGVNGQGVTEVLAACGFEATAAEVGKDSFTSALIDELGANWRFPIAVNELHSRLIQRLRNYKPGIARDKDGRRIYDKFGSPCWEKQRRRTPTYGILTHEKKRRSIVLAPHIPEPIPKSAIQLKTNKLTSAALKDASRQKNQVEEKMTSKAEILDKEPQNLLTSFTPQSSSEQTLETVAGKTRRKAMSVGPPKKRSRYMYDVGDIDSDNRSLDESDQVPRVLLSIRVSSPHFDVESWKEWIRDLPPDGEAIQIDGVYGSLSTMLLVTMPVSAWDLLPDDPAYSFVGFVTTENLLPGIVTEGSDRPRSRASKLEQKKVKDSFRPMGLTAPEPKLPVWDRKAQLSSSVASRRPDMDTVDGGSSNSGLTGWTCSDCGESRMNESIHKQCITCGHKRCSNCDGFMLKK